MASHKGQGSTTNGRDSHGQRRGVKSYDGEKVPAGAILVRQRGTQIHPGINVGTGRDWTLFSKIAGIVKYEPHGAKRRVSVYPQ